MSHWHTVCRHGKNLPNLQEEATIYRKNEHQVDSSVTRGLNSPMKEAGTGSAGMYRKQGNSHLK